MNDDELTSEMLRKEALREIEYQQRRAFAEQFVRAVHADFLIAIHSLHQTWPESSLFREWSVKTQTLGQSEQALVEQVAEHESDAPVSNVFFRKTLLNTRFFPAYADNPIRFVARVEDLNRTTVASELTISGYSEGIRADLRIPGSDSTSLPYESALMIDFLRKGALQLP